MLIYAQIQVEFSLVVRQVALAGKRGKVFVPYPFPFNLYPTST
ncbi:hypothetical protein FDUTEX481_00584 [Tolypothrix sp. PCC 7601]|nr:hypothetical protein FDUTEX481_00584 [Tolypothrix sp. PCC 7601]